MTVERNELRRNRRRQARVGARVGAVALLSLGAGTGCGHNFLRTTGAPNNLTQAMGRVDEANPDRTSAWVDASGKKATADPKNVTQFVRPAVDAVDLRVVSDRPFYYVPNDGRTPTGLSAAAWGPSVLGTPKVAASSTAATAAEPAANPAETLVILPTMPKVPSRNEPPKLDPADSGDPVLAASREVKITAPKPRIVATAPRPEIAMPVVRDPSSPSPEVDALLIASRQTKIAPPLVRPKQRTNLPVVSAKPAAPSSDSAVVEVRNEPAPVVGAPDVAKGDPAEITHAAPSSEPIAAAVENDGPEIDRSLELPDPKALLAAVRAETQAEFKATTPAAGPTPAPAVLSAAAEPVPAPAVASTEPAPAAASPAVASPDVEPAAELSAAVTPVAEMVPALSEIPASAPPRLEEPTAPVVTTAEAPAILGVDEAPKLSPLSETPAADAVPALAEIPAAAPASLQPPAMSEPSVEVTQAGPAAAPTLVPAPEPAPAAAPTSEPAPAPDVPAPASNIPAAELPNLTSVPSAAEPSAPTSIPMPIPPAEKAEAPANPMPQVPPTPNAAGTPIELPTASAGIPLPDPSAASTFRKGVGPATSIPMPVPPADRLPEVSPAGLETTIPLPGKGAAPVPASAAPTPGTTTIPMPRPVR